MNKILLTITLIFTLFSCARAVNSEKMNTSSQIETFAANGYDFDTFTTPGGHIVNIAFIKHGSIAIEIDGYMIYADPVTIFGNDLSVLPKADMILVTHEHHDHFDPKAIEILSKEDTRVLASKAVADKTGCESLAVGENVDVDDNNFSFKTFPAYNTTPGHLNFHPQARGDVGFVFDIDGFKVYVAGDTEDIPEMASLRDQNINVAFLPVNQPYTMTPAQAIHAIEMINPKIVYPYHYGETDLSPIVDKFAGTSTDVRVRQLQ